MKKLLIIAVVALLSISAIAQKKNSPEARAEKAAKEMQTVLGLDETEYKAVYEIHLAKANAAKAGKVKHGDNKEAFKAEMKKVQKETQAKLKKAIGTEQMKKWNTHLKEKKQSKN